MRSDAPGCERASRRHTHCRDRSLARAPAARQRRRSASARCAPTRGWPARERRREHAAQPRESTLRPRRCSRSFARRCHGARRLPPAAPCGLQTGAHRRRPTPSGRFSRTGRWQYCPARPAARGRHRARSYSSRMRDRARPRPRAQVPGCCAPPYCLAPCATRARSTRWRRARRRARDAGCRRESWPRRHRDRRPVPGSTGFRRALCHRRTMQPAPGRAPRGRGNSRPT